MRIEIRHLTDDYWSWRAVTEDREVLASGPILTSFARAEQAVSELMGRLRSDVSVYRVDPDGSHFEIATYDAEGAHEH